MNTVILGTGGTIAGIANSSTETINYSVAEISASQIVSSLPALDRIPLLAEQVAQIDSKDMNLRVWRILVERIEHYLAKPDVSGIVITHGTDTLEETAYFLQRVLAPTKPVVLTAAMRPATSVQADGPQNLLDAVALARMPGVHGVLAMVAGTIHSAADVRKVHTYKLDVYGSSDNGPLGYMEGGRLRRVRDWPRGQALGSRVVPPDGDTWPWVEIVTSHGGADGRLVRMLTAAQVDGILVACTGNGTVHVALIEALAEAARAGVQLLRSTRVAAGPILGGPDDAIPSAGDLVPAKARIELLLQLLRQRAGTTTTNERG
ncbi:MAG: asparaginase [Rhizobacter sp.]|nr:asparaginase [Rhizobacter sp.]